MSKHLIKGLSSQIYVRSSDLTAVHLRLRGEEETNKLLMIYFSVSHQLPLLLITVDLFIVHCHQLQLFLNFLEVWVRIYIYEKN